MTLIFLFTNLQRSGGPAERPCQSRACRNGKLSLTSPQLFQNLSHYVIVASMTDKERFVPDCVTLVADDLTGALDSAASFADSAPASKVPVVWSPSAIPGRNAPLGVSTETRELSAGAARSGVLDAFAALPEAGLHFKKIDSLARGNTAVEIAACAESGLFTSLIVAPAFPQQGRCVDGGRIEAGGVVVDLSKLLAEAKVTFETCAPGAGIPVRTGVALCDAATDADLNTSSRLPANGGAGSVLRIQRACRGADTALWSVPRRAAARLCCRRVADSDEPGTSGAPVAELRDGDPVGPRSLARSWTGRRGGLPWASTCRR